MKTLLRKLRDMKSADKAAEGQHILESIYLLFLSIVSVDF